MSDVVHPATMHTDVWDAPVFCEELELAIRDTLKKLADVEKSYSERRATLEKRSLSQGQKARLGARLDAEHKRDREPLVLHLADLHYRMVRATMFGTLAKPVPAMSALRAFGI